MLSTVIAAVLGACLSLNSRSRISAALVAAALVGAAHLAVETIVLLLVRYAAYPGRALSALEALGVGRGDPFGPMAAAGASALIVGLLLAVLEPRPGGDIVLPGEAGYRKSRRRRRAHAARSHGSEALHRIDDVLGA